MIVDVVVEDGPSDGQSVCAQGSHVADLSTVTGGGASGVMPPSGARKRGGTHDQRCHGSGGNFSH